MYEHWLPARKRLALVAHDQKKPELLAWVAQHQAALIVHDLYATGTTGRLLEEALGIPVTKFQSGPLGGDQQIGAKIASGEIDGLIFFWDPLTAQPHEPDVSALLRIAAVWNIAIASTLMSADFLISSPWFSAPYCQQKPEYRSPG